MIDTHPVIDVLTQNALYAAQVLLTPIKFDNYCRDNLATLEDVYYEILESNSELEWKVFANMVSNSKAQKKSSVDLIVKHNYPIKLRWLISPGILAYMYTGAGGSVLSDM